MQSNSTFDPASIGAVPMGNASFDPTSIGAVSVQGNQNTEAPGVGGAALQTAENYPKDVWNFGVGATKSVLGGLGGIKDIPGAATDLFKTYYNNPDAIGNTKDLLSSIWENVIPSGIQKDISVGGEFAKDPGQILPTLANMIPGVNVPTQPNANLDTAISSAEKTNIEQPFSTWAPMLMVGREVAYKVSPEAGAAFDNAISKTGQVGAKPLTLAGNAISGLGSLGSNVARFGVGQELGLEPSTIKNITKNQDLYTGEQMSNISRESIGAEIKNALNDRINQLSETGKAYGGIRSMETPAAPGSGMLHTVPVDPGYLGTLIKENTGLTLQKGKWQTSGAAEIREPGDVRAIQAVYDRWQPEFKKGNLTTGEFLNFRTDLGKMAKYERELTKSKPLENLADIMRGKFNTAYRKNIPGLEDLDKSFAPQIKDLKELKKGVFDKSGKLLKTGQNTIANAINKGRGETLAQLEKVKPGITQKLTILRTIEDIEKAGGNKVGAYARAMGLSGVTGWMFGGPVGAAVTAIVGAILATPEVAVPLLRAYGWSKEITGGVINALMDKLGAVNQSTQNLPTLQSFMPRLAGEAGDYLKTPRGGLSVEQTFPTPDEIPNTLEGARKAVIDIARQLTRNGDRIASSVELDAGKSRSVGELKSMYESLYGELKSPKDSGLAPITAEAQKYKSAEETLYTTNEQTKNRGIQLLTKAFGDKDAAISHATDYWAKEGKAGVFYHATKEISPFGIFDKKMAANMDIGLRSGVSNVNGLYVGRDVKALHNFYNLAAERGENIITYKGNPKLLDLTDESTMQSFVKKFSTGKQIENELSNRGYDGIKYFDPYSTGEEIVITNQKVLEPTAFNGKPLKTSSQLTDIRKKAQEKSLALAPKLDEHGTPTAETGNKLADPVEGGMYYHGTIKENKGSLLKNGFNVLENKKGFAEQPEAFYIGDYQEASMYGDDMVGVRVKAGQKINTLSVASQEWADVVGKSKNSQETGLALKEIRNRGYDAINYGAEIEILNPSKFEIVDAKKTKSLYEQVTGKKPKD